MPSISGASHHFETIRFNRPEDFISARMALTRCRSGEPFWKK